MNTVCPRSFLRYRIPYMIYDIALSNKSIMNCEITDHDNILNYTSNSFLYIIKKIINLKYNKLEDIEYCIKVTHTKYT